MSNKLHLALDVECILYLESFMFHWIQTEHFWLFHKQRTDTHKKERIYFLTVILSLFYPSWFVWMDTLFAAVPFGHDWRIGLALAILTTTKKHIPNTWKRHKRKKNPVTTTTKKRKQTKTQRKQYSQLLNFYKQICNQIEHLGFKELSFCF